MVCDKGLATTAGVAWRHPCVHGLRGNEYIFGGGEMPESGEGRGSAVTAKKGKVDYSHTYFGMGMPLGELGFKGYPSGQEAGRGCGSRAL